MKSKLGITVGLFGAGIYLGNLIGGTLAAIILVGYVLMFEENEWLRITVVKAAVISMAFSMLAVAIGLIPDAIEMFEDMLSIFNGSVDLYKVNKVAYLFRDAVYFAKTLLLILLAKKALNQGTIKIGLIDGIIQKHYKDVK